MRVRLCAVPATVRTWIIYFEQTKRETTCEIKTRHSHHLPEKNGGFCLWFFEMDARSQLFFVSLKFSYECRQWNTLIVIAVVVAVHTSLVAATAAAAAVVRLFWFSYLLTIYLSSVTLHKCHGEKDKKHYNYHTLRFQKMISMELAEMECVLQLVHILVQCPFHFLLFFNNLFHLFERQINSIAITSIFSSI